jgi:hypothetical protein
MSPTCFEPEGSSAGRRFIYRCGIVCYYSCISISSLVGRRVCSTYKTDACKTHCSITVYTSLPEDEHSGSKHVEDIKK